MNYLTTTQILAIHDEVICLTGGALEVRNIGMLESAIARPQATFDRKDLYPDIFTKAAALGTSIIANHPFVDGNKRTAYLSMRIFLNLNGYDLKALLEEKHDFIMRMANGTIDDKKVAIWLKHHSRKEVF